MRQFIRDRIKLKLGGSESTSLGVASKADYRQVRELTGVLPAFADRWLVEADFDKVSDKDFMSLVSSSHTCCFLLYCSRYRDYKKLMETFSSDCEGLYLLYIRRPDFVWLYDSLVPESGKMSKNLLDWVVQSYSGDVDMLMELLMLLNSGRKFSSRTEIMEAVGIGGLSVEGLIFSLCNEPPHTARGMATVLRNRVRSLSSLVDAMGHRVLYERLSRSVLTLCRMKMLDISGVAEVPDSFDCNAIARYARYRNRLRDMPLSSLLYLRECMGGIPWGEDADCMAFIYRVYGRRY